MLKSFFFQGGILCKRTEIEGDKWIWKADVFMLKLDHHQRGKKLDTFEISKKKFFFIFSIIGMFDYLLPFDFTGRLVRQPVYLCVCDGWKQGEDVCNSKIDY